MPPPEHPNKDLVGVCMVARNPNDSPEFMDEIAGIGVKWIRIEANFVQDYFDDSDLAVDCAYEDSYPMWSCFNTVKANLDADSEGLKVLLGFNDADVRGYQRRRLRPGLS